MSTIRVGNIGPLTGNTSVIADPGVSGGGMSLVSMTAVASTSGTSIDFTGIPSWARRITIGFHNISTNGSSMYMIQIGAGSIDATSYMGSGCSTNGTAATSYSSSYSSGFLLGYDTGAVVTRSGIATLMLIGSNTWAFSFNGGRIDAAGFSWGSGSKVLSGTLDRVRFTTVNGTDTFDLGSVNVMYE